MFLRLLPRAPANRIQPWIWRATVWIRANTAPAGQIVARQAVVGFFHIFRRALKNDPPAAFARPRSDFDDLVGRSDHRFLMFHDDHRISPVGAIASPPR